MIANEGSQGKGLMSRCLVVTGPVSGWAIVPSCFYCLDWVNEVMVKSDGVLVKLIQVLVKSIGVLDKLAWILVRLSSVLAKSDGVLARFDGVLVKLI
jgi:hypothetical protein